MKFTIAALLVLLFSFGVQASPEETIQRVKASVVAIGTHLPTRSPPYKLVGTGFVVGDGTLVATNAHAITTMLDVQQRETLVVALPAGVGQTMVREAVRVANDADLDLAVLRIKGPPLPALKFRNSDSVREGQTVYFTGFPITSVLGLFPATHRAMVSALTPPVVPGANSRQLTPKMIRRLSSGGFMVFQLDGTAYPGNSGSPLYDPDTGEVVGIINATAVKSTKEAALSDPSGITYAIPAKYLEALIRDLQ